MVSSTLKNQSLLFWCCKPLGLKCLELLLELKKIKYPELKIEGIVISTRDESAPDIEKCAYENGIPILDENTKIPLTVDLGLCIGFPEKLPLSTIHKCQNGLINLHFAPLPHYRGSGTLTHAIVNGESRYGLTFHYMDESLDTGDVIAVKWMDLDEGETALDAILKLEKLGFEFFNEYAEKMLVSVLPATSQTELIEKLGVTPRFCTRQSVKDMYEIPQEWSFEKIHRYLRALTLGKSAKPFFKKGAQKIYLSLSE